jgi:hypothetical protein
MSRQARIRRTLDAITAMGLTTLAVACNAHPTATSDMEGGPGSVGEAGVTASAGPGGSAASGAPEGSDSYADKDPTALQDFHPALDAHGTWADDPKYGTVWTPNAAETGPSFAPYVTAGHWVYDELLWTSDYDWGWAPFHYGRWVLIEGRGWSWIPGREYAPAWVEWRTGDEYLGWAPAPPLFVWQGGVAVTVGFAPPPPPFVFCAHADLFAPQPGRVVIMGPRAVEIESRTRIYEAPGQREHYHPGPPLASLHIAPERVVHATGHEHGCERALAFARPSTAVRVGAHPPVFRAESERGLPPRGGPEPRPEGLHQEGRPEGPRPEGPRPEGPRPEGPRPEGPRPEGPHPEGPHSGGPRPEGPRPEEPHPEGPHVSHPNPPPVSHGPPHAAAPPPRGKR